MSGRSKPKEDTDRFKKLPERIRLEDTVATHPTADPPDSTLGRDTERDFMLRNAGA